MKKFPIAMVFVAAILALGVAGCGDDNDTSGAADSTTNGATEAAKEESADSGAGGKLALAADPNGQLKYDKTSLDAKAGDITIELTNDSDVPHDVEVESGDEELGKTDEISGGQTAALDLKDVKAGTYTYYCTVPGHEQAGMKGTLTVE